MIIIIIIISSSSSSSTGLILLRSGTCECGNEPSGSIKCGEFLRVVENRLPPQVGLCSME
jgi:hypothetical protein